MRLINSIFKKSHLKPLKNQLFPNQSIQSTLHNKIFFNFSLTPKDVEDKLREIKVNDTENLLNSGLIQRMEYKNDKLIIELKLDQNFRKVKSLITEKLEISYPEFKNFEIKMAAQNEESTAKKEPQQNRGYLDKVQNIIAVSSCKGGVGKSTVALNLAFSLHKLGYKVGIYDADIYGPSLPTLISSEKSILQAPDDNPKAILPIDYEGVKAMSYGFVTQGKRAVMRGPMASSVVAQLVMQTLWGELDYLIVDMPPGTGDIQITIGQELKLTGAVIVTTPQKLSFIDVVKGIELFDDLKVPTLSVVENMSEFVCNKCDTVHQPFGMGYIGMLQKQFGIKSSTTIPIYQEIARYSDMGTPLALVLPEEHTITKLYTSLAKNLIAEVELIKEKGKELPIVRYQTGSQVIYVESKDQKKKIKASDLRKSCQCAMCIDEFSGKKILDEGKIDDHVFPHKIEPKGNYAVAIIWSDGHKSSIYPYELMYSDKVPAYKEK